MDRIKAIERAWIRDRALSGEILDDVVRSTYSYALRLASSCALPVQRTHGPVEYVDITPHTNELRSELESILSSIGSAVTYPVTPKALSGIGILAPCGKWHRTTLVAHYPAVAKHLRTAIGRLFRAYPCIDESSIERELRQKALVLALGGGGGTGYAHVCLFRWLEECGIAPELITGTSFGAIAGYLRSLQTNYDAAMTMLKLPGYWKFIRNLHPCIGTGTHGLMGICRIDFDALCEILWRSAGYSRPPAFGELKIPFAAVATGILATSHLAAEIEPKTPLRSLSGVLRLTQLSWRKAMHHAAQIANLIVKQGDGVEPVVFGFDDQTRTMSAIDGVAFSALVPGVINAEIPPSHTRSRAIVDDLFNRRALYRLADGGLTSNVPARAAHDEVQNGRIRTRNSWILGIDVFAPQARDGVFYPLQQIANDNVCADARFADTVVRLKDLLSPMELSPSLSRMHWLNNKFRKAFDAEMKVVQYATAPLLPLHALDLIGFDSP